MSIEVQSADHESVGQMVEIVRKYIAPVIGVALVIAIVAAVMHHQREKQREEQAVATSALDAAQRIQLTTDQGQLDPTKVAEKRAALAQVIADHPGTASAQTAAAALPALDYQNGDFEAAAKGFADFAAQHPQAEPLTSLAKLGQANSLLALGQLDQAQQLYQSLANPVVAQQNPGAATSARTQAALIAAARGEQDTAERFLQDLEATGDPAVTAQAENLRKLLASAPRDVFARLVNLDQEATPEETPESSEETPESPSETSEPPETPTPEPPPAE